MKIISAILIFAWFFWSMSTVVQGLSELDRPQTHTMRIALAILTLLSPIITAVPLIILHKLLAWIL
jgi:hypothetical protein